MILNILGPGGSGKSTLKFALKKLNGFHTFVPITTRNMRKGEIDGIHYRFVTIEQFRSNNSIILIRDIGKDRLYGNDKYDIVNHKSVTITTLDVFGIRELEHLCIELKVVFLNIAEDERVKRMKRRGDSRGMISERLDIDKNFFQNISFKSPMLEINGGSVSEIIGRINNFLKD